MIAEPKTYRGRSLDELLPKIRAELGDTAVVVRQREGIIGGIGGFFGKRCVEVEAQAADTPSPIPAVPARALFDAYDGMPGAAAAADDDDPGEVIRAAIDQAKPFAEALADAEADLPEPQAQLEGEDEDEEEDEPRRFEPIALESAPGAPARSSARDADWRQAATRAVDAGLPAAAVEALVRDAQRMLEPFHQTAEPLELMRRVLARQIKVEHGWRTRRRTIAVVGAAGVGKTLTVAKLCHAYHTGSAMSVRAISLEPAENAARLGALLEHLGIEPAVAETPAAVAEAVAGAPADCLTVIDTPPVSARNSSGIAALARRLEAAGTDEVHLVVPAWSDSRATTHLAQALGSKLTITRLIVTQVDEAPTASGAVGTSLALKRPVSYVAEGRGPANGLRPADEAELALLAIPDAGAEPAWAAA